MDGMRSCAPVAAAVAVLVLSVCPRCSATDWFVRPGQGSGSGRNDGTSYGNAWRGFGKVDWSRVKPGDNLYVCDVHVGGTLTIGASGIEGRPIVIRGDWPNHRGVVLGASALLTGGWVLHDGKFNVWKRDFSPPAGYSDFHAFARPVESPPVQGLVRLHNVGKPESAGTGVEGDFARYPPGSYYRNAAEHTLYFKPVNGPANDYVYYAGYEPPVIHANGKKYFELRNLTVMMGGGSKNQGVVVLHTADHIVVDKVTVRWGSLGIVFGPYWPDRLGSDAVSEDVTVSHCTVHDCRCGIYPYGGVNNCRITDNHVYRIGQRGYYLPWKRNMWYGDIHGIAIQGGGNGLLIARNHVHDVGGEGIFPYGDNNPVGVDVHEMRNFRIVRNLVHDLKYLGSPAKPGHHSSGKEAALYYNQNNDFPSAGMSDNVMAYNVVYNAGHGVRLKCNVNAQTGKAPWNVYNNVFYNTGVGVCWYSSGSAGGKQPHNKPGVVFVNNIIANARSRFVEIAVPTIKEYDQVVFDHNLYYPRLPAGFVWPGGRGGFAAWRRWTAGVVRDTHSRVANPKFRNASVADFHLLPTSPAIDTGTSVGLAHDHDGAPVPRGRAPDIGAFEFASR